MDGGGDDDDGDDGGYLLDIGFGPLGTSCLLPSNWRGGVLCGCSFMDWEDGERSLLAENEEATVVFNWSDG